MKESFFEICSQNNTDKVNHHGYHFFYPIFLEKLRGEDFNMLEIGFGTGKSIKAWNEYFPNCNFFCMDIRVKSFSKGRNTLITADQSKTEDLEEVLKKVGKAKLIVDDGSHHPKHQYDTFIYFFKNLLEDGGIYIIEDIETSYWKSDASIYGYRIGNFDLAQNFRKFHDMINQEFSRIENELNISTITYAQNCIIITKRTKEEVDYFNREYRFSKMIH